VIMTLDGVVAMLTRVVIVEEKILETKKGKV
jgi:hypothetical protein